MKTTHLLTTLLLTTSSLLAMEEVTIPSIMPSHLLAPTVMQQQEWNICESISRGAYPFDVQPSIGVAQRIIRQSFICKKVTAI